MWREYERRKDNAQCSRGPAVGGQVDAVPPGSIAILLTSSKGVCCNLSVAGQNTQTASRLLEKKNVQGLQVLRE